MEYTDVRAIDGSEIKNGDTVRISLPPRSAYKGMVLAEGKVFFQHGSFRVPQKIRPVDSSRLDDFSNDCIIEIIA